MLKRVPIGDLKSFLAGDLDRSVIIQQIENRKLNKLNAIFYC
jgi:hypothetical protein